MNKNKTTLSRQRKMLQTAIEPIIGLALNDKEGIEELIPFVIAVIWVMIMPLKGSESYFHQI